MLALIPARAVSAEPPDFNFTSVDVTSPMEPQLCPGMVIMHHELFDVRGIFFYDNQGNLKSIKAHLKGEDFIWNPQNPEVVLSGKFSFTQELDPTTFPESIDQIRGTGLFWHIIVPGYGGVVMQSGLWGVPDLHLAGKDSFTEPKDVAALCSLLAGH